MEAWWMKSIFITKDNQSTVINELCVLNWSDLDPLWRFPIPKDLRPLQANSRTKQIQHDAWSAAKRFNTKRWDEIKIHLKHNQLRFNTSQYHTIQCNTSQCNAIQYNISQSCTTHLNTTQCNATHLNTMQYNKKHRNIMQQGSVQQSWK